MKNAESQTLLSLHMHMLQCAANARNGIDATTPAHLRDKLGARADAFDDAAHAIWTRIPYTHPQGK